MIGVVGVIAILAALAAPAVIRRIDLATNVKESNDMGAISNAVALQILISQRIPTEATWQSTVATWNNVPLAKVGVNPRGQNRVLLIDTNGWLAALPTTSYYNQPAAGVLNSCPTNARMLLVSCTSRALPAGVTTGRPDKDVFAAIWDTTDRAKPNLANWTAWAGKGEDLVIQRINLTPMWHRLTLVNRDKTFANYAIAGTNLPALSPNSSRNAYYLNGTELSLCDAGGLPDRRVMLTKDESFVFEGGIWKPVIGGEGSSEIIAQDFAAMGAKFLAAQWYTGAHQGGDQQGALVAMFNFMLIYGMWANECPPHFPDHGANKANVPEYQMLMDLGGNGTVSRINEFTGTDGLLK
jgi:type II secretory pathway pseudopilin PulG